MANRQADPTRRALIVGGASVAWLRLGVPVPHLARVVPGLLPVVASAGDEALARWRKGELMLLNDRPLNAETPAHLLDDAVTPVARHFVRNNGLMPEPGVGPWTVRIAGEACRRPMALTVGELQSRYKAVTLQLQLECGGNGRSEFRPRTPGNQWTTGGVGCAEWTGVRLADVLDDAGVADAARYVAYVGADRHLSGATDKRPISRGVPIGKAMERESLLAFAMNGEPLTLPHGAPIRLVFGGWPASASGKWVTDVLIRDRVHDGEKMGGKSYRVPCEPVAPGSDVADEAMCIIESMPVKSLISHPRSGITLGRGEEIEVRGHAWAGDDAVRRVHVSSDFGATWQRAALDRPANRLAWQHFRRVLTFDEPGYYEIWARATDVHGRAQPMLVPGWNPKGYLNNACHRIAVQVT